MLTIRKTVLGWGKDRRAAPYLGLPQERACLPQPQTRTCRELSRPPPIQSSAQDRTPKRWQGPQWYLRTDNQHRVGSTLDSEGKGAQWCGQEEGGCRGMP